MALAILRADERPVLTDLEAQPAGLELLRRGYDVQQIRMILGENFLRVLTAAERAKRT